MGLSSSPAMNNSSLFMNGARGLSDLAMAGGKGENRSYT
jgi:hypothetical protein